MQQVRESALQEKWTAFFLIFLLFRPCLSDVLELTKENYSIRELSRGKWLLFLGTPTCPYCRQLLPIWKELAMRSHEKGVTTAAVNCLLDKEICDSFGIARYPTIYFLNEGNLFEFKGHRNVELIERFYSESYQEVNPLRITDLNRNNQSHQRDAQLIEIIQVLNKKDLLLALTPFLAIALAVGVIGFLSKKTKFKKKDE